jgi:hypothetical protein
LIASEVDESAPDFFRVQERKTNMTLCLAGICRQGAKESVVLCSDTQGTDFAKSHDTPKMRGIIGTGIALMFCDRVSAALEMMTLLEPPLKAFDAEAKTTSYDNTDLLVSRLLKDIRAVTTSFRAGAISDFVNRRYGLAISDFYQNADAKMRSEVASLHLGCEVMIAHAQEQATIIHVDSQGEPHWVENYHGMGSGWLIARSILCQEDWPEQTAPMDGAVRLLIAKQCAEKDPYVGNKTQLAALLPGKPVQMITNEGFAYACSKAKRFRFPTEIEDKKEYFLDAGLGHKT